jgi:UDP-N-acetylmuramate dehydrogenase
MIEKNISLKPYNTFGIEATARYFSIVNHLDELKALLSDSTITHTERFILGGGSNVLLTKNFDGLVIHNRILGIEKTHEDAEHVYLKVGAGENWHQFVLYCVRNHYAGIENLSLIPGTVGAAPIQNIGAYGIELKDHVFEVHTVAIDDQTEHVFNNEACAFGYRDSIFKHALKDKHVITHVVLRLNKKPVFHVEYGGLKDKLNKDSLSIQVISDAIIDIRQAKLPDPKVIGNAGSFFKNPIVPENVFLNLQKKYSDIPFFKEKNEHFKIPAAWLIEQCGFKGMRFGEVGIHAHQALVLVNYGNGTGEQIKQLSENIKKSVKETFIIELMTEVNII